MAITGAALVARTSRKVWSETWEISTIIPRRFISRTTCWPKSVSPLCVGLSVQASAHSTLSA